MLDDLLRKAVDLKRVDAERRWSLAKECYRESENRAIEHLAKLIEPETIDQVKPELIEAIEQEQKQLDYMWSFVMSAQARVETYKRWTNDSKVMQEFIDRHMAENQEVI